MFLFQIEPYKIAENSFWVKAEEDKFESPELFARLAVTFGTQMKGTSICLMLILSLKLCKGGIFILCTILLNHILL